MTEQKTPAMFDGVKPPPPREQPKPDGSAKPSNHAAGGSGAPVGRFAFGSAVPVLALIGVALWVTVGPVVALIVVGALVAIGGIAMFTRSAARRRVATTTRRRPDGSITTTTKPVRNPRWSDRRRNRSQRTPRDRGPSGSDNPGGRSRWRFRQRGGSPGGRSGDGSPTRSGRPGGGGRPGGSQPGGGGQPGDKRRSFQDWMTGRNKGGAPPKNPAGRFVRPPAGSPSPGGRKPQAGGQPAGQKPPGQKLPKKPRGRWSWSRNQNQAAKPPRSSKPESGNRNSTGGKSRGSGGSGSSNGGGGWLPGGGKSRTPTKDKGGGESRRGAKGITRTIGRTIAKSHRANLASTPASKSKRGAAADTQTDSGFSRRTWWSRRQPDSSGSSRPERRALLSHRWRRQSKLAPTDFKAQLDQRWVSRGIGDQQGLDPTRSDDPTVRRAAERRRSAAYQSSPEAAAFAEDWKPAPQQYAPNRHSAEAGLMGEGDWKPEPRRAAPRSANQGGSSQMSDNQDQSTAVGRQAAANASANAAARVSAAKASLADSIAARVSNREGMQAADAGLRAQAAKARQDAATMGAEAGKMRQFAATVSNLFRNN